jgi:hypothetical protein
MKLFICLFVSLLIWLTVACQAVPPPYNGRPDIRMDTGKEAGKYVPPPYWTIWFNLASYSKEFEAVYDAGKCIACDSLKYHPHGGWVQSYDDSATAYQYYHKLRSTGKVLMWGKYECGVDTTSVWIDKYSVQLYRYLQIKQPSW